MVIYLLYIRAPSITQTTLIPVQFGHIPLVLSLISIVSQNSIVSYTGIYYYTHIYKIHM